MYRALTSIVLSADRPSQYSEQLLTRLGLLERFDKDPELVLAALRGPGEGLSREYLFVLAELSFYHAVKSQKAKYFLASAVYAYAFALGGAERPRVDRVDPRVHLAANLYTPGWPRAWPAQKRRRCCSNRGRGCCPSAGSRSAWTRRCSSGPAIA